MACGEKTTSGEAVTETTGDQETVAAEIPEVRLATATKGRLPLRRQATGRLRARRAVVIRSQSAGPVLQAPTEGLYYRQGDVLLTTDPRPLELARDRAVASRDEADFRHRELLLRLRGNLPPGDSTITELARANILVQSGLPAAEVAVAEAEYQLGLARLAAPFGGRAADVRVQTGTQIAPGEEICNFIDPNSLEVEFSLLEQELARAQVQAEVVVTPVAQPELRLPAVLDIINPQVDEGGLLRVRARLTRTGKLRLYPGMNVTVTLATASPPAVLVPKAAVVVRSGRTLVFSYDATDQRAKWQYITVSAENDEQVAISEGLEDGATVIVSGNLTLDHDSPVRPIIDNTN